MKILALVDHPRFTQIIMALILLNAILVGLETYPVIYDTYFPWIQWADRLLLWAFTVEIALRLVASRPTRSFFRDGWNVFDFIIVVSGHVFVGSSFITVLRILRVLRVLRAISVLPSLRRIVTALLLTLPSLAHIAFLLSILFYIFAVTGTMLFAEVSPEYFGTLHETLLTLMQVLTLDSWANGMMRPMLDSTPWAWIYFILFVLLGSFIVMNLIIGVIVTNLDRADNEGKPQQAVADQDSQLQALRQEVGELKTMIRQLHERGK